MMHISKNQPTEIPFGLKLTAHAARRMCERAINKTQVAVTLATPDEIVYAGKSYRRYVGSEVTVVASKDHGVIATVYHTEHPEPTMSLVNQLSTYQEKLMSNTTDTNGISKSNHLTFGQLNAIRKAALKTETGFSVEMGHARNWFTSMKTRKKLGDKLMDKTAFEAASTYPELTARWLSPEKMAYLEKTFSKTVVKEYKTSEKPPKTTNVVPMLSVAKPVKAGDKVATVKRALFGILNEDQPINMKLNDDLFAKIVRVASDAPAGRA